jgi:hypothetical protein
MEPEELQKNKEWFSQREAKHLNIGKEVVRQLEDKLAKLFCNIDLPELSDKFGYRNRFNGLCGAWVRTRIPPECLHIEKYKFQCFDVGVEKDLRLEGNTQAHEFYIEVIAGCVVINNIELHQEDSIHLPLGSAFFLLAIEDSFLSLTIKPPLI